MNDVPSKGRSDLSSSAERDALALARDLAARVRDQAAEASSRVVAGRDGADADGRRALTGAEVIMRAAGQRKRAADQRDRAAEQREVAAEDRRAAALDRAAAAAERLEARADREALIVELRQAQADRVAALFHQQRTEVLARTLQRSLSPPRLPRIAGLDVAVHHEPSAPEEVGGDFYDLFPLAAARSGFFLGDVCGKGPQAAAVTSLARYTMRTAAMLREAPAEILLDLNAALRMETAEELQMCTAVYGEIRFATGGAVVTLVAAGHPPPLVVRADGSVETTATRGALLGAFEDPTFQTCQVHLAMGDAVVISSDGILDTEIDGVRTDEHSIGVLLSGTPHARAAALVDRLVRAIEGVTRPLRDDVAIMALRRSV